MQNVDEEKLAILSSGKDQRKKERKKYIWNDVLQEVCLHFGSHVRPEVDKGGQRLMAVMAKKFCPGACSMSRCLKAWGYSGLLCLWWVKGGMLREEQLQQLQLSSGHWSLEHQHNSSLQSVLAAKSKSIPDWAGQTCDGCGDAPTSPGSLLWCSCFRLHDPCCSCSAWLLLSFGWCSVPEHPALVLATGQFRGSCWTCGPPA